MMVLAGVAMIILQFERQANGLSTVIMGLFYILMAVIYFFPAVYLYRFATASADAIEKLNEDTLEEGLENLKSLFRFTGILMIIMFSLYAIGIIAVIAAYVIQM
jgi:tellurite resistance protein TehA-like permease